MFIYLFVYLQWSGYHLKKTQLHLLITLVSRTPLSTRVIKFYPELLFHGATLDDHIRSCHLNILLKRKTGKIRRQKTPFIWNIDRYWHKNCKKNQVCSARNRLNWLFSWIIYGYILLDFKARSILITPDPRGASKQTRGYGKWRTDKAKNTLARVEYLLLFHSVCSYGICDNFNSSSKKLGIWLII